MSLRLSGTNQLAYLGVTPLQPPDLVYIHRNPISGAVTNADYRQFNVGTFWLNPTNNTLWILVSKANNSPFWLQLGITASGFLQTLTADNAVAVPPTALNINVLGDANIITVGHAGTSTLNVTLNPNINVTSVTTTNLTVNGTAIFNGPIDTGLGAGVVQSPGGGGPLFSSEGTDGQVLISSSIGVPIWHTITAGSGITVTNGHNTITIAATGGSGTITSVLTANATPQFNLVGTVETVDFGISNLILGTNPGGISGLGNIGLGLGVLALTTTGAHNVAIGLQSLASNVGGANNVGIGYFSLNATVNSGNNVALGYQSLLNLASGSNNVALGMQTGTNYVGAESNNILIGFGVTGTAAESNVLRIGQSTGAGGGQLNKTFIQGINGASISNPNLVLIDTVTSQLAASGSAPLLTLTGNSGVASPTGGGTINIVTANTTLRFVGAGSTITQNYGLSNLILGNGAASIAAATNNVGLGLGVFNVLANGTQNVAIGSQSLNTISNGTRNTAIGYQALNHISTQNDNVGVGTNALAVSMGSSNTAVGSGSLDTITTGSNNIAIGMNAGSAYTSTEANNILIGNAGTLAENAAIHIGTNGVQTTANMAGVYGVTVGTAPQTVVMDNTGKLGTAASVVSNGLVFIQTQTAVGATALNFTASIGAPFNNFLILFNSLNCPTAAADNFVAQISINGGASYISSGYTSGVGASNGLIMATLSDGNIFAGGSSALLDLTSGSGYIMSSGTYSAIQTVGPSFSVNSAGSVYNTVSTTANAFRLTVNGVKPFSGTFSLYGYSQ